MTTLFAPGEAPPPIAILAGGLATRMRPQTDTIPKSLLPVAGRPFLAHQLDRLRAQGLHRVVLCVGHLGEQIEAAFGDGRKFGLSLDYSYDGPGLLGTAGALRNALPLLGTHFFSLYGDSYLHVNYASVWKSYRSQAAPALMTVIPENLATEPANAWFKDHQVLAYGRGESLPEMRHVDYGLSIFNASVFHDEAGDLSLLQAQLAQEKRMAGFEVTERYFEIGSRAGFEALASHLKAGVK